MFQMLVAGAALSAAAEAAADEDDDDVAEVVVAFAAGVAPANDTDIVFVGRRFLLGGVKA